MVQKLILMAEQHVEKIVLGAAGLFAVIMIWTFLLNSPNRVDYSGRKVGPTELAEAIKRDADGLQAAMRSAEPKPAEPITFAADLERTFTSGLAASAPGSPLNLAASLRNTGVFGPRIQVPGLEDEEEAPNSVSLVTALKPRPPVVQTGRSMAYRDPLLIEIPTEASAAATPARPASATPEARELPWVTVAAYYDTKAQYQEMTRAGYASYRARPYVVHVEVQRQEQLETGAWSDWQDLDGGEANPELQLPEPRIDDQTGKLLNKGDLDAAFRIVKQEQWRLMQPPFYVVDDGDFWQTPPLPGLDQEETAVEAPVAIDPSPSPRGGGGVGTPTPAPPPTGGGGRFAGGGGGGRFAGGGGGPPTAPTPVDTGATRRQLNDQLRDAERAYRDKDWATAMRTAEQVIQHGEASRAHKNRAQGIIRNAQRQIEREQGRTGYVQRDQIPVTQVMHPDQPSLRALWFHDDTVESGKTYRYRMRVRLWNRYVGQIRPLKDMQEAREVTIVGEWSDPSNAITVTPTTHFFVAGPTTDNSGARFEVWRWRNGRWIRERFEVAAGEVIGGVKRVQIDTVSGVREDVDFTTGAVVLDIRQETIPNRMAGKNSFSYRDQDTLVVVYLDPADGQVKERTALGDRTNPIKAELEEGV